MKLPIPELSLVVLIGASGSGKSTFARKHFKSTEIISSDYCRGLVSDDENNQAATRDAFEVLHFIVRKRLAAGRLTVVDATNVQSESRKPLIDLAREFHCLPVAVVLNLPERLCHERNAQRPDRNFGPHVIRQQVTNLRRSLRQLQREGFRHIHVFSTPEEVESAEFERQPLWNNLKSEHGPFDIIGDVHGCSDELIELLETLGYQIDKGLMEPGAPAPAQGQCMVSHPAGRKAVFLGDLVDRGPAVVPVLRLVMNMVECGAALCVPGNHDMKLLRKLSGRDVQITHGLGETLAQLDPESEEFRNCVKQFIDSLVSHYVLDDGKLVVAHAGMKEDMQGRGSGAVREFALFGETTGETDEFGLPVRYNWAADYRGRAVVVYGHTPVPEAEWLNHTIDIDTGCVFGGKLTALRYPERELVSVPARHTYCQPVKPLLPPEQLAAALSAQQVQDDTLEIADVIGKRLISTRLRRDIMIREENSIAALEVMSRFAANPKWLVYLPPTMSPCETSKAPGVLEHPAEAFDYFLHEGIPQVVCEQKHMGSRAVVIVCRDEAAARARFGVVNDGFGICYTRTGRRFFDDRELEREFLTRIRDAAVKAGFFEEFKSDWFCFDCELMPWSAKARELIRQQYAAVGAASRGALDEAVALLEQSAQRSPEMDAILSHVIERRESVTRYAEAWRRYCWNVSGIGDLKLAPFHLLASEARVHIHQNHVWHMETLGRLCAADPELLLATPFRLVDVTDSASRDAGAQWWEELTGAGGEGMVVKPLEFAPSGRRGLVQPAVKCRGREYLRIIYGPEYLAPENLERLRVRGLQTKRMMALREFALGIEALERFVRHEPLRRVHECVFGVLAMESEPVDPRL
jgi:protein phosphatase